MNHSNYPTTSKAVKRLSLFLTDHHIWLAVAMLVGMFCLSFGSMINESAIMDEVAHIPAAYANVAFGDYRLNPEHPPLVKALAATPLLFLNLKFPVTLAAWTTDINGQWESGWNFLYHIGNNADQILFWSRLPILLLAIFFGGALYAIVYRQYGRLVALLTLLFYCFSPNFLAHSHYVTTDLGASVFFFLALIAFVHYVSKPGTKNLLILSVALALAQLTKFSAVLIFPYLLVVTLILVAIRKHSSFTSKMKTYVGGLSIASVISVGIVWVGYVPFTYNTPEAVQDRLIQGSLITGTTSPVRNVLIEINDKPAFKPLAQYILGVGMVFDRVDGGNLTYFNGQVSNMAFKTYFPQVFLQKTQLAFLLLMLLVALTWIISIKKTNFKASIQHIHDSVSNHPLPWVLCGFSVWFFSVAVYGNLNLGVRHILPIYIPLFVVVALGSVSFVRRLSQQHHRLMANLLISILGLWYMASALVTYPHFLPYFNELAGGGYNADKYFSDSNVDWGQDLKNFKTYLNQNPQITSVALDYFGGGDPKYYLCERSFNAGELVANASGYDCSDSKYVPWHADMGNYTGQYIAVSQTYLEGDRYYARQGGYTGYAKLRAMTPQAKIGNSIYLYKLY